MLLVAPVVEQGATTREVTFPPGSWTHWFTGEVFEGSAVVDAPLGRLPLFAAEGAIVPMLRPTIDTMSPATEPDVDSYANDPGVLWPRIYPGPATELTLFDGTRTADETAGKPNPQMLLELMREFGADPERTLMIGDTTHDLQLARNAGCPAIAVTYGAHAHESLRDFEPLLVAHDVPTLRDWLLAHA